MKKEFTIGEICELYSLGVDSIRYYEKNGLISPKRLANGYRVYSIDDTWKLNIIKDLRKLDFSIPQIKEYLENRTLDSTIEVFKQEIKAIDLEITPLMELKADLEDKIKCYEELKAIDSFEVVNYRKIKERRILFIEKPMTGDGGIDLALRELESIDDEEHSLLGNKDMGVLVSKKALEASRFSDFQMAFFFVRDQDKPYHMKIQEGTYATLLYRGSYHKSKDSFAKVVKDLTEKGHKITGHGLEIYRLDIHSTKNPDEFITEIQICVS